jgi:hypothetical protein
MSMEPILPVSGKSFVKRYPYPFVAFVSSALGFLCILTVIVFPALSVNIALAGLYFLGLGFLCGFVGLFVAKDYTERWVSGAGILSSMAPFILYFILVHLILPFLLRGLGS